MPCLARSPTQAAVAAPALARDAAGADDDEPEADVEEGVARDLECPVCAELLSDAVAGPCGHALCRHCIGRLLYMGRPQCPLCRQEVAEEDLRAMPLLNLRVAGATVCCPRQCGWRGRCDQRRAHWRTCPAAQADEFAVVLEGELGIVLDLRSASSLSILRVEDDLAVGSYNERMAKHPEKQIRSLCTIVEANSVRGDPRQLLYEIQQTRCRSAPLRLVLRRPDASSATVEKRADSPGLTLRAPDEENAFVVVQDSSLADEQVKSEDRIAEVGGLRGTWRRVLERAGRSAACSLKVARTLGGGA